MHGFMVGIRVFLSTLYSAGTHMALQATNRDLSLQFEIESELGTGPAWTR